MKTVNDLSPGERGVIDAINSSKKLKHRLMDMGIIEGVEVEMIRTAPLGDPVMIKVHKTLIAIRKSEAVTLIIKDRDEKHRGKRHRHRFGG